MRLLRLFAANSLRAAFAPFALFFLSLSALFLLGLTLGRRGLLLRRRLVLAAIG
jgi:hypothetical protein